MASTSPARWSSPGPRALQSRSTTPTSHNVDGRGSYPPADTGLLAVTGEPEDMGKFRAPTLRNVAVTAPYMHDGSIATLSEVVEHYVAGGRARPVGAGRDPLVHPLDLSEGERRALVTFLEALTDRGFLADPRFSDPESEPARSGSPARR
ncbi:MAG: hypothetical protein R2991_06565 [Thermoanaerobaculia bacterium]